MEFQYRFNYKDLSDKQIVDKILEVPHDEEAAVYLLHDRYAPLLHSLYRRLTKEDTWFDDCVNELFILLKGKDCNWYIIANFGWRCTFGYWLKEVAWNKFCEVLPKLTGNDRRNVSIDNCIPERPTVRIPVGDEESHERRMNKVMLMEAIGLLENEEQRFVILKRLEGYSSKEIAMLLQMKWERCGIRKYNKKNEPVVPSVGYVNVHMQRAKEELRRIMSN